MRFQFAGLIEKFDSTDTDLISYSITAGSNNGYFYLQGWSRSGRNLLSDAIHITSFATVSFTLKSALRNSGDDLFSLTLSYCATNTPANARQVYRCQTLDDDQLSFIGLPDTVTLIATDLVTTDVTTFANLPVSPKNGALRYVIADATYYEYSDSLGQWIETDFNGLSDIALTTDEGGCDRSLELISSYTPPLPKTDDSPSTPIKFSLVNDGSSALPQGYVFNLQIRLNGGVLDDSDPAYTYFAERIKIRLLGYVDNVTRILDTGIDTVGTELLWNPAIGFPLPSDLESDRTAIWEMWVDFLSAEINLAKIPYGSTIEFLPYFVGQVGVICDSYSLIGNVVLPISDRLRVVAGVMLGGQAIIGNSVLGIGYSTQVLGEQTLPPLQSDTADQIVAINVARGGDIVIRQSLLDMMGIEGIRAFISTESGESLISAWSSPLACTADSVTITLTHPITSDRWDIRNDYPDVIAGLLGKSPLPPPKIRIYINDGSDIYRYEYATSGNPQIINLTSLSALNIASLPATPDTDFSLYASPTPLVAISGAGSITATIQVAVTYYYPSPNLTPTKVSHDIGLGCIPEINLTLTEAINLASYYSIVQSDGVSQTQRTNLNFSDKFSVTDSSGNDSTTIDYIGFSGHVIQDGNDVSYTARENLKFNGFVVSDVAPDTTMIELPPSEYETATINESILAGDFVLSPVEFTAPCVVISAITSNKSCQLFLYSNETGQQNEDPNSLLLNAIISAGETVLINPNLIASTQYVVGNTFWAIVRSLEGTNETFVIDFDFRKIGASASPLHFPKQQILPLSAFTWTVGSMTWWQFSQLDNLTHSATIKCELETGTYTFKGLFRKGSNQGIVTLTKAGYGTIGTVDNYTGAGNPIGVASFGTATLTKGIHTFSLTVTGKNGSSSGYIVEMDYLLITHGDLA